MEVKIFLCKNKITKLHYVCEMTSGILIHLFKFIISPANYNLEKTSSKEKVNLKVYLCKRLYSYIISVRN